MCVLQNTCLTILKFYIQVLPERLWIASLIFVTLCSPYPLELFHFTMSQRMARRTSKLVQNADSFVTSACQSLPELAAQVWDEVANIKHQSEKYERNVALKSACSNGLSFCKVQNAKLENTKETWQGNLPARVGGSSLSFWTCSGKLQPHNPSCCIPLKVSIGNFQVSTEIHSISRWSYGYCSDFVWYNSTER